MMYSKKYKILAWIWFGACYLLLVGYLTGHLYDMINSDLASELILAKDLADKGKFVLDSEWIYSTEIRVLNTQLIFSLLFRFINNWALVLLLGTIILDTFLLICIYFLCCQIDMKQYFPLIGGIFMCPISDDYLNIVLGGVYYIPHICISIISLSLLIKLYFEKSKYKYVYLIILLGLSMLTGMGGLRQILVFYIPSFMAIVVWIVINQVKGKNFENKNSNIISSATEKFIILSTVGMLFGAFVGYCINKYYLSKHYTFFHYETIRWTDFSLDRMVQTINGLLHSLGFRNSFEVFSIETVGNVSAIIVAVLLLFSIWNILISKNCDISKKTFGKKIVVLYFTCACIAIIALYGWTDMSYVDRYNLPIIVWFSIIIAFFFDSIQYRKIKTYVWILFSSCCLFMAMGTYKRFGQVYDNSERDTIAQFLVENEYYNGYATFWNGNIFTALSNGRIDVWVTTFEPDYISDMFSWLQKKEHMTTEPDGKIFFITTVEEQQMDILYARLPEDNLIYQTQNYKIYGFDSMQSIPENIRSK